MKNYTSNVPVERTISRIEQFLARAGASNIVKRYEDGQVTELSFLVMMPDKTIHGIRLPINVAAVMKVMKAKVKKPHAGTIKRIEEQAARTAWKLVQDWVEIQLSMIEMEQAEFLQIFLPYLHDGKKSFFEAFKLGQIKFLTAKEG